LRWNWLAIATCVIAIATIVVGVVGWLQWKTLGRQLDITKRALVAVERPILILSIPGKTVLSIGRPQFSINVENTGGQVANSNGIAANLVIQSDSNFPSVITDYSTGCTVIPVVGEIIIKPLTSINILCQRQRPISSNEVEGIAGGRLYAFFVISFVYQDSAGVNRITEWVSLLRPSGRFVQIFSVDRINEDFLTPDQQEENQRALVDTEMKIERERGYPFPGE
jgi:hypothetical protein